MEIGEGASRRTGVWEKLSHREQLILEHHTRNKQYRAVHIEREPKSSSSDKTKLEAENKQHSKVNTEQEPKSSSSESSSHRNANTDNTKLKAENKKQFM